MYLLRKQGPKWADRALGIYDEDPDNRTLILVGGQIKHALYVTSENWL